MKTFQYWNNQKEYHGELLTEIQAENIISADKQFEEKTKLNPAKNAWIGCTILK